MSKEEAIATMRQDIVTLLSKDPHCPIANLLGQAFTELLHD